MKKILFDKNSKFRLGWQIISVILVSSIASLFSVIIASIIYQNLKINSFSGMISDTMDSNWGHALCSIILILILYCVFRFISKWHKLFWYNIGFTNNKPIAMTIFGFLCGIVICLLYIIPLYLSKQIKIELLPFSLNVFVTLILGIIIYAGVSFSEEIVYRGFIQYSLDKKYKDWSIIITALLFTITHFINSSYSPISFIYLFIGGISLSLMRIVTKGIWFTFGFHITWNWVEITVFGLNNNNPIKRWFFTSVEEVTIWTGSNGNSGLAIILPLLIITTILLYIIKVKKIKLNN